jgi:hypothetical protein
VIVANKKDVELAAHVPECSKKITEIRTRLLAATQAEEQRREAWGKQYHTMQGEIRNAEIKLVEAAEAEARIVREVPREMRQAAESAGVAVRAHGEALGRARQEAQAVEANYQRRLEGSKRPGGDTLTKAQIEQFLDEVALKKGVLREAEEKKRDLESRLVKAKKAVDDEVARIKKAAR